MTKVKSIEKPDERRDYPRGHIDVLELPGMTFGVATFEPGWRWSESVKDIAKTPSCQVAHQGYCAQGRMRIRMDDGNESEVGPGDVFVIEPGHDAWTVGDETCVLYDISGSADYAKG